MATSLDILKINFRSIIYTQNAFIQCKKIALIAHCLSFAYDTKLVATATSLEILEKEVQIDHTHPK